MAWRGLTTQPWEAIRLHFPQPKPSPWGGRPRVADRRCFEGILWILWTGAQWRELPRRYGRPPTGWRRLKWWEEMGVRLKRWRAFLAQLHDQQQLRGDACGADGRFIPAKQGGPRVAQRSGARARGRRWEQSLEAASPAEVTRLETTRDTVAVGRPGQPGRHHQRATHQDGRTLRRYRRRWISERTFAWLGHCRRLVVRDERLMTTDAGFFPLACALLTFRRVLK